MRQRFFVVVAVVLSLFVSAHPSARAQTLHEKLVVQRLDNGLTVLYYPRPETPVFSAVTVFNAGAVDEPVGSTGIAHLLEHMAFKGTDTIGTRDWQKEKPILDHLNEVGEQLVKEQEKKNPDEQKIKNLREELKGQQDQEKQWIVKDEIDEIYTRNGGENLNATTANDFTTYFISLPSTKFELWAMMESERIGRSVPREFYLEKNVVAEERRQRTDNWPVGKLWETFMATAYLAHPYSRPVVGWMSDIQGYTPAKMKDFYGRFYTPENCTIALVGDIKAEAARATVEKYFGRIARKPDSPEVITVEPDQTGERRAVVEFDTNPHLLIGYHKPVLPDRADPVFEVMSSILTDGRSSRLYERMVKKDKLATTIESFTGPGDKYPNLFMLYAQPRHPHTAGEVEAVIGEELDRLKREPVTEEELQKVKNNLDGGFLRKLQSNYGLAHELAYYAALTGDPLYLEKRLDLLKSVTPDEIKEVASKYLTESNRTAAVIRKPVAEASEQAPPATSTDENKKEEPSK
ncbi:MAG: pitrilysin family protein [bacterium]